MSGTVDLFPEKYDPLPLDLDYIPDNLISVAKNKLFEDENTRVQCLKQLRAMLRNEEDLLCQDDDLFLLSFLRARKFDVNRAFNLIKNLYNCFGKRNLIYYRLTLDDVKRVLSENSLDVLPYRDHNNCPVFIFRYRNWNPENSSAEECITCTAFSAMVALHNQANQIGGGTLIGDFKGFNLKHLIQTTPSILYFLVELGQNAFPIRLRGIHIVNESSGFYYIWKIVKPFLSKKIQERVHVHGKDMKSLHKFVPPRILPAELEGDMPPYDNSAWSETMVASFDYIKHVRTFGYKKFLEKKAEETTKSIMDIFNF